MKGVTVTRAEVSADLQHCKVFVSLMGTEKEQQLTMHGLRSAAGFTPDADPALSHAWLDSLSIGGTDGTLTSRFRGGDVRGRIHGKTGTLSTVSDCSANVSRPISSKSSLLSEVEWSSPRRGSRFATATSWVRSSSA